MSARDARPMLTRPSHDAPDSEHPILPPPAADGPGNHDRHGDGPGHGHDLGGETPWDNGHEDSSYDPEEPLSGAATPRNMVHSTKPLLPQLLFKHQQRLDGNLSNDTTRVSSPQPLTDGADYDKERQGVSLPSGRRSQPSVGNGKVGIRDRIQHFTWAWFTTTMSTGGLSVVLYATPHRFAGLTTIGKTFYVLDLVIFTTFVALITTRFILCPRALRASLLDPVEGFFFAAFWLSLATIIGGMQLYGVPSAGPWLVDAIRVLFWLYAALTLLVAIFLYWTIFANPATPGRFSAKTMTPIWIFPIFPVMLTGTVAALIAPGQPPHHRLPIIVAGVSFQGLGWCVALCITAVFLYRLFCGGLLPPNARPGMFMMVGAPSFTALALIGNARNLPDGYGYFAVHPLAVEVLQILATWIAVFLWSLAMWLCFLAALSCVAAIPKMEFSVSWWTFVFPNIGFTVATIDIGEQLGSEAVQWVGTAMTVYLVCMWFFVAACQIRAVVLGKVLWPGKDEDRNEPQCKRD